MLLDVLKDFEWLNEPEKLTYSDEGMLFKTNPNTDFWQSSEHHINKDNGHFFFAQKDDNFTLTLQWKFGEFFGFRQCGIMLRFDEKNWAKLGLMSSQEEKLQIGSVVTTNGNSDWAVYDYPEETDNLWFQLQRIGNDYIFFISGDGQHFQQIRLCSLSHNEPNIKIGAYACSPQNIPLICQLQSVFFE